MAYNAGFMMMASAPLENGGLDLLVSYTMEDMFDTSHGRLASCLQCLLSSGFSLVRSAQPI